MAGRAQISICPTQIVRGAEGHSIEITPTTGVVQPQNFTMSQMNLTLEWRELNANVTKSGLG